MISHNGTEYTKAQCQTPGLSSSRQPCTRVQMEQISLIGGDQVNDHITRFSYF